MTTLIVNEQFWLIKLYLEKKDTNNVQISPHTLMKTWFCILVWQSILVHYEKIDPSPPHPVTNFTSSEDALIEHHKNSNTQPH